MKENKLIDPNIVEALETGKTVMVQMREGGFVMEMAKLYARFVRELQAEGFSREEAMRIVVAAQLGQQK